MVSVLAATSIPVLENLPIPVPDKLTQVNLAIPKKTDKEDILENLIDKLSEKTFTIREYLIRQQNLIVNRLRAFLRADSLIQLYILLP